MSNNIIKTGFDSIDEIIGGWHNGDFVVIAGVDVRINLEFLLYLVMQLALESIRSMVFFQKLSVNGLIVNFIIISTEKTLKELSDDARNGNNEYLDEVLREIHGLPIWVNFTQNISIDEFKNSATNMVRENDIKIIFIENLRSLCDNNNKYNSREDEIAYICKTIKELAKELNVTIIAMNSMEKDFMPYPYQYDSHKNITIIEDADMVLLLTPKVNHCTSDKDWNEPNDNMRVIISKNTHGNTGVKYINLSRKYSQLLG